MWTTDSSKTLSRWMKIEKTKKSKIFWRKIPLKFFFYITFSLFCVFFLLSFPRFLLLLRKFLIRAAKLFHLILIIFIFRLLFGKNNFVNNWEEYNVPIAIAIVKDLNFFSPPYFYRDVLWMPKNKCCCSVQHSNPVLFLKAHKPTCRTVEQGDGLLTYPQRHRMLSN